MTRALQISGPRDVFVRATVERRPLSSTDVSIDIAYCGICRSDVHHVRDGISESHYPMVPGHEIAGVVGEVGPEVTLFAPGDRAGVGCMVDSCRRCPACSTGLEQYCRVGKVLTYNAMDRDGRITQGGYSKRIVVDQRYVVPIPDGIALERAAPLMCAGITMYSPLRRWGAAPGSHVGIVGLGGLGHLGVKLSDALGAHTTAFTLSGDQASEAGRLGADEHVDSSDPAAMRAMRDRLDLIVCTVPLAVSLDPYLDLLGIDGTLVNLGVPQGPIAVDPYSLFRNRRSVAGSLIGSIAETREMLELCGASQIGAEVEVISADAVDHAYDRLVRGDVHYRFVLDCATI
jgi:alcohol dehydrogenase (NADP+)